MLVRVAVADLAPCVEFVAGDRRGLAAVASLVAQRYRTRVLDEGLAPASRAEALAAGLLLRAELGVGDGARFTCSPSGKPELPPPSPAFNISHGGGLAVLATAAACDGPVGVDVERPEAYCRASARRVLDARQVRWIEDVDGESERARRFCRAWTRMEAVLKAQGSGFDRDPRSEGLPAGWPTRFVELRGHIIAVSARKPPTIDIVDYQDGLCEDMGLRAVLDANGGMRYDG